MFSINIPLVIMLIGVIITIIGYNNVKVHQKNRPKVIYKFITQNLDEEEKLMNEDIYNVFSKMFTNQSLL